jgi:hypothetical protein
VARTFFGDISLTQSIALEPVDALTITTLVDNVTDSLLPDEGPALRPPMTGGPRMPARVIIEPTCDALAELAPDYLVPTHCTGWRATHALAARFPNAFIQNAVGTRFEFVSGEG